MQEKKTFFASLGFWLYMSSNFRDIYQFQKSEFCIDPFWRETRISKPCTREVIHNKKDVWKL